MEIHFFFNFIKKKLNFFRIILENFDSIFPRICFSRKQELVKFIERAELYNVRHFQGGRNRRSDTRCIVYEDMVDRDDTGALRNTA